MGRNVLMSNSHSQTYGFHVELVNNILTNLFCQPYGFYVELMGDDNYKALILWK